MIDTRNRTVDCAALALQGVDNIESRHCLSLGVLGVGDSVPDDVLEKGAQHVASLLVHEPADTLHASASSQTANCWLGDTGDAVGQLPSESLGTPVHTRRSHQRANRSLSPLAEAFAALPLSFSTALAASAHILQYYSLQKFCLQLEPTKTKHWGGDVDWRCNLSPRATDVRTTDVQRMMS